jgi:hypothetical protein
MNMTPKAIAEKIRTAINTWETLRPTVEYAGLTVSQFTAVVQPSLTARVEIEQLKTQLVAKQDQRDAADETSMDALNRLVNGIRAVEGNNSPALEPLGYTLQKECKSGLHRGKNGNGNVTAPS